VTAPNSLVLRAYLIRGAWLWIVARGIITGALLLAGSDALHLSPVAFIEVVLLIVALGWIDMRRRRESVFLANLGVSPLVLSALFGVPALLGEMLVRTGAFVL
jgi:hypothetical protein